MDNRIDSSKIKKLEAIYNDKTRGREERHQALEELAWERYRADKRPAMTLRKSKFYIGLVNITEAILFLYIAVSDTLKLSLDIKADVLDISLVIIAAFMVIAGFFYLFKIIKYKVEPADDLAKQSEIRASIKAVIIIYCMMGIPLIIFMIISYGRVISMTVNSVIFFMSSLVFLHTGLSSFLFFAEEGKVEAED